MSTNFDPPVLARAALSLVNEGGSLTDAIRTARIIAARKHHVAERAWFSMQLAVLREAQGAWKPDDLFGIWREIDVEFPGEVFPALLRQRIGKEYGDSRALPSDPSKLFTGAVADMEDLIAMAESLAADSRGIPPVARTHYNDMRAIYDGIRAHVVDYLTNEASL